MPETVYIAIIVLLIFLGVIDIVRIAMSWFFTPKKSDVFITVIPLQGHVENAEQILRNAIFRMEWFGHRNDRIVALDFGVDRETRRICEHFSREYQAVGLYTIGEFERQLSC